MQSRLRFMRKIVECFLFLAKIVRSRKSSVLGNHCLRQIQALDFR